MHDFFRKYTVVLLGMALQALLNMALIAIYPEFNELGTTAAIIYFALSALWLMGSKNPVLRGMFYNSIVIAFMILLAGYTLSVNGQLAALGVYMFLVLLSTLAALVTMPVVYEPEPEAEPRVTMTAEPTRSRDISHCPYCARKMRRVKNEDDEYEYQCPGCGSTRPA